MHSNGNCFSFVSLSSYSPELVVALRIDLIYFYGLQRVCYVFFGFFLSIFPFFFVHFVICLLLDDFSHQMSGSEWMSDG